MNHLIIEIGIGFGVSFLGLIFIIYYLIRKGTREDDTLAISKEESKRIYTIVAEVAPKKAKNLAMAIKKYQRKKRNWGRRKLRVGSSRRIL